MEKEYNLIDIYLEDKDGNLKVTKNGNRWISLLVGDGDDVIYESVFFTKKAHWKTEVIFNAFGATAPDFEEIAFKKMDEADWTLNLESFQALVGKSFKAVEGTDKGGYKKIIKWCEPVTAENIEVRDNGTDASETVQDAIDNEVYGEEEEDDVPF
jgi:hypothetical protein